MPPIASSPILSAETQIVTAIVFGIITFIVDAAGLAVAVFHFKRALVNRRKEEQIEV